MPSHSSTLWVECKQIESSRKHTICALNSQSSSVFAAPVPLGHLHRLFKEDKVKINQIKWPTVIV